MVGEVQARDAVALADEVVLLRGLVAGLTRAGDARDLGAAALRDVRPGRRHVELEELPPVPRTVEPAAALHHRLAGEELEDRADRVAAVLQIAGRDPERLLQALRVPVEDVEVLP